MKTLLVFAMLIGQAPTSANSAEDLLALFSTCSGRLSAQTEHYWLTRDSRAGVALRTRDDLRTLTESVLGTPEEEVRSMALRLEAKVAHASLLTRATFNADSESAALSTQRAEALVSGCATLVLRDPAVTATAGHDSTN